jgi:hypothetical protein
VTSSSAAAASGSAHKTVLRYAAADSVGITIFNGQAVNPSDVLVRYTYAGDANLDGKVNALDFNAVAGNSASLTLPGNGQGDFNYDNITNTLDFTALAQNFNQVLPSPAIASVVPQPATLFVAAPLLRRRRLAGSKSHEKTPVSPLG